MIPESILSELRSGENQHCEFKRRAEKSLADEAAAFANASGGKIYIGVDDDGSVCGTDTSNRERARIEDTLIKIEPRIHTDLEIRENIIVITVPEGENKPYMTPNGFFLRFGTLTRKMTRSEIIELMQDGQQVVFDSAVNSSAKYPASFNPEAFASFLSRAKLKETGSREDMLLNLGAVRTDGKGAVSFTNAGVLFFAKRPVSHLPNASVVCALYKGLDKTHILDRKAFEGTVIENIEDTMLYLQSHLNVRYEISGLQRKEIFDIPETALREVVVNAVCHRNYFEQGACTVVEIFDDRVVVSNPGGLVKGLTREMFGKVSVARNPVIASMLQRAEFIEKMGSGISRINQSMTEADLPEAVFEFDTSFLVSLYRDSFFAAGHSDAVLSKLGSSVLDLFAESPKLSVHEAAVRLGKSDRTIFREVKKLEDERVLFRVGANKNGSWRVRR